jgi:hypothetical protein
MPYPGVSHLLVAYAAWPSDRKARDQYVATNLGLQVAHLERRLVLTATSGTPLDNVMPNNLSGRSAMELFGGWEAVAETAVSALGDRLDKVQEKWPRVADVFHVIVDRSREAG